MTRLPVLEEARFTCEVLHRYARGEGYDLPESEIDAQGLLPPGTAAARDLGYVASDLPALDATRCTGCMECVVACPDAALLGRVLPEAEVRERLAAIEDPGLREDVAGHFARTRKFAEVPQKRGLAPALFGLFVDPARCKGCGECVEVCGDQALAMRPKDGIQDAERRSFEVGMALPETPEAYVQERVPADWMLQARSLLYTGGAGSCPGCGEATAIRMMLAATGHALGPDACAIVAATGCNTVFGSTWPYNPFRVPWTNSLFENAPAVAMGLRLRWDQRGFSDKRIWVVGGDGALYDIGFGSLSRLLASGMDVKVLVLDTQVYSNTGGQASTATFRGQQAKMSTDRRGRMESRKELGLLALAHGDVYVAQTTTAHVGHFFRAIVDANAYPGPALVNVYCPCQPEHGIADSATARQSRLAVSSRAFPLLIHDPRRGETLAQRLSLQGNPSGDSDWHTDRSGQAVDFVAFARSERRFARQFAADGAPTVALLEAQAERLRNWRRLRELSGALS